MCGSSLTEATVARGFRVFIPFHTAATGFALKFRRSRAEFHKPSLEVLTPKLFKT